MQPPQPSECLRPTATPTCFDNRLPIKLPANSLVLLIFRVKYKYILHISFKRRQFWRSTSRRWEVCLQFKKQNLLSKWNDDWLVGQAPKNCFFSPYTAQKNNVSITTADVRTMWTNYNPKQGSLQRGTHLPGRAHRKLSFSSVLLSVTSIRK